MDGIAGRAQGAGVDRARYERLYAETVRSVTAYARSRLPPDEAADVVADTYLVAWRRLADVPVRPLPWLLVVARNTMAQRHRATTRNAALVAEVTRLHDVVRADGSDVADEVVERLAVLAALDTLGPLDREALVLTVWDGLSARVAARVAGCSAPTFTVRLHRARARLTRALAEQDADGDPGPHRTGGPPVAPGAPTTPDAHTTPDAQEA